MYLSSTDLHLLSLMNSSESDGCLWNPLDVCSISGIAARAASDAPKASGGPGNEEWMCEWIGFLMFSWVGAWNLETYCLFTSTCWLSTPHFVLDICMILHLHVAKPPKKVEKQHAFHSQTSEMMSTWPQSMGCHPATSPGRRRSRMWGCRTMFAACCAYFVHVHSQNKWQENTKSKVLKVFGPWLNIYVYMIWNNHLHNLLNVGMYGFCM